MGRPKALLPYRGTTFLERILEVIRQSSISDSVVVLGHDRDVIARNVEIPKSAYNPDYEKGMMTSFQVGIRALPDAGKAAMLFLVDHPLVSVETIERLQEKFSPGSIVLPVCTGRRGHPVLFSRDVLDEILEHPPDCGANTVVRARPERVIEVPVDDPTILIDVDTPDEFEALGES